MRTAGSLPNLFLKPENLQPFGSYKIRGVAQAFESASKVQLANGVQAASAGNMAQAVAFLAREQNLKCEIFVPDSAPEIKTNAIRSLGATLIKKPFSEIWDMIVRPPTINGLFIHPVFTPGLLEGYSRIAEELIADISEVDAVVIPFGVGGLTLAIAERLKMISPQTTVYAAEPETAAPLATSLTIGGSTKITRTPSFIDAIGTPEVLPVIFARVLRVVRTSLVVSVKDAQAATVELMTCYNLKCEGAAAVAFSAAKCLAQTGRHKNVICILSGGNISTDLIQSFTTTGRV